MIYEVWLPTLITFCPHTAAIIYTHNFRCPPSSSLILERAQTNRPGITNSLRTSIEAEIFNDFDHSINGKMLDHYRSLQASNWPWFHMVRCTVDHFYAFCCTRQHSEQFSEFHFMLKFHYGWLFKVQHLNLEWNFWRGYLWCVSTLDQMKNERE